MDDPTPAGTALTAQYLAARGEAESARQTAEQFTARAARADATADELRTALIALGQPVPAFPPVPVSVDPDETTTDPPDEDTTP